MIWLRPRSGSNQVRNGKSGNPLEKTSSAYHISSPYLGRALKCHRSGSTGANIAPDDGDLSIPGLSVGLSGTISRQMVCLNLYAQKSCLTIVFRR